MKWEAVAAEPAPRFFVLNADEGEPGTIKDRYLMELRPHLVLEGVVLAMRFAEAAEGFIYLREEYAASRARLTAALAEFRAAGLLDGLSIELVIGAGAYICGEETAMLESMEGRRGMPRLKPPFPSQVGYLGRPTLINNVETLAHVPAILRMGGEAWAALGVRGARGVRLFSVSGAVAQPGCYEAPNGSTLREIVELAGGATEEIGAIVPGGAASGILPPAALDVPLVRDELLQWGAGIGSAGVQVFPASYPPAAPAGRDDALLRRGVVPEVHAVPDRQPRHPPRPRGAGARSRRHVARADRGVARRDGEDLDLRPRPGRAAPGAQRVPLLARPVRAARRARGRLTVDDPLARFRDEFLVEDGGPLYADGNSLGRLPLRTRDRLTELLDEWGTSLVRGWHGWIELPEPSATCSARPCSARGRARRSSATRSR